MRFVVEMPERLAGMVKDAAAAANKLPTEFIRDLLRAFGPDVIHAHQPTAPSTGLWVTLEARAPVVGTFHSGAARARLYDLGAPLLRRVAGRLAIRIAVSRMADSLSSLSERSSSIACAIQVRKS